MMDYDKLIEQYRQAADEWEKRHPVTDTFDLRVQDALRDAATALKAIRTELSQMAACVYYKHSGLCRYGGDDPANVCVLGPCPHERTAEEVLADLARVTAERDAAVSDINAILSMDEMCPLQCQWCAWHDDCDGEKRQSGAA